MAELIVHAPDRTAAIGRMAQALEACVIEGVKTTVPFLRRVMDHPDYRRGAVNTQMVERGAFNA